MYANNAVRILDLSSPKKLLSIDNSKVNNQNLFYVGRPSSPRSNLSGRFSSFRQLIAVSSLTRLVKSFRRCHDSRGKF